MAGEDVLALAPDAASAKAGRELANASKWQTLGSRDDAFWGECNGSGAQPYRTRVERVTSGYSCSCPSRKFPCKHVLGLMLLAANGCVSAGTAPPWVIAWLESRAEKREPNAKARAAPARAMDPTKAAIDAAKRSAVREGRVALGLDEMERWLCDIVRLGLARVQSEPPSFWDAKAARLVDAQAPGVARRVRALSGIAASGSGWERRLLEAFGSLYLLREAYARIDRLSTLRRADVRRYIGWTQREDETIARTDAIVADRWTVIGTRVEEDERVIAHRAWLVGERTGNDALVLQFTQPGIAPAHTFAAGTSFEARLAYYEASVPQRVAVVERNEASDEPARPRGNSIDEISRTYARAIANDPWFEVMPVRLAMLEVKRLDGVRYACDEALFGIPIHASAKADELDALCGSRPIVVAAEWNGRTLHPLGAWTDDRYVALA